MIFLSVCVSVCACIFVHIIRSIFHLGIQIKIPKLIIKAITVYVFSSHEFEYAWHAFKSKSLKNKIILLIIHFHPQDYTRDSKRNYYIQGSQRNCYILKPNYIYPFITTCKCFNNIMKSIWHNTHGSRKNSLTTLIKKQIYCHLRTYYMWQTAFYLYVTRP